MVTAAQGAEKYYTLAQAPAATPRLHRADCSGSQEDGEEETARHESPEDARSQDEKTAQVRTIAH